jgi:AcrR family transcriptional regulator
VSAPEPGASGQPAAQNVQMASTPDSARKTELLAAAYDYALANGLAEYSLRPLAAAIGTSPRVLLFLFGSKDGLTRALLARARAEELAALAAVRAAPGADLAQVAREIWAWLAGPARRALLTLWLEGYARSLLAEPGPWERFARETVTDWLALLGEHQPPDRRASPAGEAERTLLLAVLRGALLDVLATGDTERAGRAVEQHLAALRR